MFTFYALIEDKRSSKYVYGFALGGVVLIATLTFGPYTGGCINFMRVLGPVIVSGKFDNLLMYGLSSLTGSLFGAFYYHFFILNNDKYDLRKEENFKGDMITRENYKIASNLSF